MLMLAVVMGIGRFAFTPLMPMMRQDAELTRDLGGALAVANYLGYLLGALLALFMRLSPKLIIVGSLFIIVVLTAAMGFTHAHAWWLALRFVTGLATAWVLVFAFAWAMPRLAGQRPLLRGLMFGGVGLGLIIVGLLGQLFVGLDWFSARGWRALGVAALALTLVSLPPLRHEKIKPSAAQSSGHTSLNGKWTLMLAYGTFGLGYIIPATYLPSMAQNFIGDPMVYGWAWPLFGLAAFISTLIAVQLFMHFSNLKVWAISQFIMAAGLVMPVFMPNLAGILIAAVCVGGTLMVITTACMVETQRLAPEGPAVLVAKLTVAFGLGQILGPVLMTVVPQGTGSQEMLLCAAALLLVGSGIPLLFAHPR